MRCIVITTTLVAISRTTAHGQTQPTYPDLTYATVGTQDMHLDLYLPENVVPPYPCVVSIHPGGWYTGNKYPIDFLMQELLQEGFAIASVSYRLTTEAGQYGPGVPVIFPAQIQDVKGAVRWLRANASKYHLDSARFGSYGVSAGGHLSALLGASGDVAVLEGDVGGNMTFSSRVQAAGDHYGPIDIINMNPDVTTPPGSEVDHDAPSSFCSHFVGWDGPGQGIGDIRANLDNPNPPYPALVALCQQTNPITFVSPDDPPFFIGHGVQDTWVPVYQSTRLHSALDQIDHPHTYSISQTGVHNSLGTEIDAQTVAFFRSVLRLPGDVNTNGVVNVDDLLAVISAWGPCLALPATCLADVAPHAHGNGAVDLDDLLEVITNWG